MQLSINQINELDFDKAIKRILKDIKSDFFYAPHFKFIYENCSIDLINELKSNLKSGSYNTKLPIQTSVIKKNNFSRPGSILFPDDRLLYQALIDSISSDLQNIINENRVFSYKLDLKDDENMFEDQIDAYGKFMKKIEVIASKYDYAIKADISSYYLNILQHPLINHLTNSYNGRSKWMISLIEKVLLEFSEKNSIGIVQGVFPSDFLGNIFLTSLDIYLELSGIEFYRYVDDIYLFFKTKKEALTALLKLEEVLRNDYLTLNESKTRVVETSKLLKETTSTDVLVDRLREEIINEKLTPKPRTNLYGEILDWEIPDVSNLDINEINLETLEKLFTIGNNNSSLRDKIDKYCINIFGVIGSTVPLEYVLNNFNKKPHLIKTFIPYLFRLQSQNKINLTKFQFIELFTNIQYEYLKIWYVALLIESRKTFNANLVLLEILKDYNDPNKSDAYRAICAIFICKFGNSAQKRIIRNSYKTITSEYIRSAIFFGVLKFYSKNEAAALKKAWRNHNFINQILAKNL